MHRDAAGPPGWTAGGSAGSKSSGRSAPADPSVPEVSFILATLNEARSLPVLLPAIEEYCPRPSEVVVVDDGSTDGTRQFLERWRTTHPNLHTLLNAQRQTTLRAQFQGLRTARGKYAVIMDSDLQHPPATLPELLAGLDGGSQLVVASRYLEGGSTGDREPMRGLISRGAAACARAAIPQARTLSDPMSGFLGIRREIVPETPRVHRGFKILLFLLATNPDLRISEVAYRFQERQQGASKVVDDLGFLRTFLTELLYDRRLLVREGQGARRPGSHDAPAPPRNGGG